MNKVKFLLMCILLFIASIYFAAFYCLEIYYEIWYHHVNLGIVLLTPIFLFILCVFSGEIYDEILK